MLSYFIMASSYTIQIPSPCSENWNAMADVPGGKHCGSCQRNLVDFTSMTDNQILSILSSGRKVCGRFAPDQLEKEYVLQKQQPSWIKYLFTVSIPALLF